MIIFWFFYSLLTCKFSPGGATDRKSLMKSRVIHLTHLNYATAIEKIDIPRYDDILKRPFTFFVEGNVGVGKTTFLELFKKYPSMNIRPEPLNLWTDLNGTDVLELVNENPQRWALIQQSYIQLTMLNELSDMSGLLRGMERSVHSARFCFVESFYQLGYLSRVEYLILDGFYRSLMENVKFSTKADLIIYLRADPEVAYERIKSRGREEESNITLDRIKLLTRLHDDWLLKPGSVHVPAKQVLLVNANADLDKMLKVYEALAKALCNLIPGQFHVDCNVD